jgi:hypothetical protein
MGGGGFDGHFYTNAFDHTHFDDNANADPLNLL